MLIKTSIVLAVIHRCYQAGELKLSWSYISHKCNCQWAISIGHILLYLDSISRDLACLLIVQALRRKETLRGTTNIAITYHCSLGSLLMWRSLSLIKHIYHVKGSGLAKVFLGFLPFHFNHGNWCISKYSAMNMCQRP